MCMYIPMGDLRISLDMNFEIFNPSLSAGRQGQNDVLIVRIRYVDQKL